VIERRGAQLFGNSWSGGESQAGRLKPPEYWQAFEAAGKREQERRRSHAVQARKAEGTYLGPSRTASPRRGQSVPPPGIPDYRSPEYVASYMADVAAAERWKDATNKILNAIYEGDAPLSEVRADGVLVAIPSQSVLSPSWQQLLGDPRSNRKFILLKSFLTALSAQAAVEPAQPHETTAIFRAAIDAPVDQTDHERPAPRPHTRRRYSKPAHDAIQQAFNALYADRTRTPPNRSKARWKEISDWLRANKHPSVSEDSVYRFFRK
jgi:hypothetical protein